VAVCVDVYLQTVSRQTRNCLSGHRFILCYSVLMPSCMISATTPEQQQKYAMFVSRC